MKKQLRDYQQEAIDTIQKRGNGKWLVAMATGLGKTFTFTSLPNTGKTLILAHQKELVMQPGSYYEEPVGYDIASLKSNGENIVCASMQTMKNRLEKFQPDEFDRIIVDECHHASNNTYRKILSYFTPKQLLGFTATPFRADGADLSEIFDEVIFDKNIEFGIKNNYLSRIECKRVNIGYDLSDIRKQMGDFNQSELARRLDIEDANMAIKQVYESENQPTIIFCVNIKHAENVAKAIGPDAKAISGKSKERSEILQEFAEGKIKCLCNVQLLTEGVDLPMCKTIIMAKPTLSPITYIQSVGRGLRLHENKDYCTLVDCVGNISKHDICQAPCLLGLTMEDVPKSASVGVIGDLLEDIPDLIESKSDCPETWIQNEARVKKLIKNNKLNSYNVNYTKHPDNSLICHLTKNRWIGITAVDSIGNVNVISGKGLKKSMKAQDALEFIFANLKKHAKLEAPLWNVTSTKRWGIKPASEPQKKYCKRLLAQKKHKYNIDNLNKMEVSCIINRLKSH